MVANTCTTFRFLKTPERVSALRKARQTLRNRDLRLARMRKVLDKLTSEIGVCVDEDVQDEIMAVVDKHSPTIESLPLSDFQRVFWNQQVFNNEP